MMQFTSPVASSKDNNIGYRQRKQNRAHRRNALKKKFALEVSKVIPNFFNCDANLNLRVSTEEINQLLDWIERNTNGLDQKKLLNNYLATQLETNRQERKWDCPTIPLIYNLPHEKNIFTPWTFGKINSAREEVRIFESSISNRINLNQSDQNTHRLYKWGQILASAVLCGGILDINALVGVLLNPRPQLFKNLVQLTLFDTDSPRWLLAVGQKRIWFTDPVTLQLIKNIQIEECFPITQETLNEYVTWVIKALNYFFGMTAKLNGFDFTKIQSLGQWLEKHQTRLGLTLAPYLLNFTSGRLKATSLSNHTYLRLSQNKYLGLIQSNSNVDFEEELRGDADDKSPQKSKNDGVNAEKAIRASLYKRAGETKLSAHGAVAQLNRAIAMHEDQAPEILLSLARWISGKIDTNDREPSCKGITQSTAYEYFTSLSGSLLEHLGSRPLSEYDIESFIGTYEEILDALDPNSSTKLGIAQRLRQFHRYLVINHNVSPIDFKVLDEDCFVSAADANLITNTEYQTILSTLERLCSTRKAKEIRATLILGYRCGLRISEVLNLRFSDIQMDIRSPLLKLINAPISLLIRNTIYNNLKTSDSRRILPLHLLIPEKELHVLLSHIQEEFRSSEAKSDCPIFTTEVDSTKPLDRRDVYAFLNPLMRQVTKDGNIRFHHLRHSFANNLSLAFLASSESLTLLYNFDTFYTVLKQHLLEEHQHQRSFLYQIATWMGHASPQTTVKNYIHILDFLLADALYPYSFSIKKRGLRDKAIFYKDLNPSELLSALTNLNRDALLTKSNKQKTVPQFIANRPTPLKDYAASLKRNLPIPQEWSTKEVVARPFHTINIYDWTALFKFLSRGKSYQDIFELLEIEQPDTTLLDQLLYSLFQSRFNRRFKQSRLVPRLESTMHTLQISKNKIFLITPPRGEFASKVANDVYKNLITKFQSGADTVRDFFKIYITKYNHDHRDIRFKHDENDDYLSFIFLADYLLSDWMKLEINHEQYSESKKYWKSLRFRPLADHSPLGESAHALHFAILVAFLGTKLGVHIIKLS